MKRTKALNLLFVESVPDQLEDDTLYISIQYATALHKCCCGCGHEVVTPLSPTDWKLTFDGAVSLTPSIGNWSFPCQSHYWIRRNQIEWAPQWSKTSIDAGRDADLRNKQEYFGKTPATEPEMPPPTSKPSWWQAIKSKLGFK